MLVFLLLLLMLMLGSLHETVVDVDADVAVVDVGTVTVWCC